MTSALNRQRFALFLFNIASSLAKGKNSNFDARQVMNNCCTAWDNRADPVRAAFTKAIQQFETAQTKLQQTRQAWIYYESTQPVEGDPADENVRIAMREDAIHCRAVTDACDVFLKALTTLAELFHQNAIANYLTYWANQSREGLEAERVRASSRRRLITEALHEFFQQSHISPVYDGEWTGVQMYTTGMNTTGLWVRHDSGGKVLDRIVRKQEWIKNHGWYDAAYWKPAPQGGGAVMPPEAFFTDRLNSRSNNHFVALRGWDASMAEKTVEIYTEFCGFGDLSALAERYREQNTPIPEPFLWFLFSQMVDACSIMENGWRYLEIGFPDEIVHRDIKPGNIFLAANSSQSFPAYPLAKMGDFGLAIETNDYDPHNPPVYARQRCGTPSYRAPEQVDSAALATGKYQAWQVGNDDKILAWTNVYAVGMTMYRLVRGQEFTGACPFAIDANIPGQSLADFHPSYSDALIEAIEGCVQRRPQDRLTVVQLQQDILQVKMRDEYMSTAHVGIQPQDAEHDLLLVAPRESYAVGLALAL